MNKMKDGYSINNMAVNMPCIVCKKKNTIELRIFEIATFNIHTGWFCSLECLHTHIHKNAQFNDIQFSDDEILLMQSTLKDLITDLDHRLDIRGQLWNIWERFYKLAHKKELFDK